MQLAFNIEVREEKQYLLSEEDSKKVMDKAIELAKRDRTILPTIPLFLFI